MPGSVEKFKVWDDFSFGEFGELGGYHAPNNSYTGSNVIRYRDGSLGPRPGLKLYTYTGGVNGVVWGLFNPEVTSKTLMVVIGDTVYKTSTDSITALSSVVALTNAPTDFVHADWYDPNGDIYLASSADRVYAINWTAGTKLDVAVEDGSTYHGTRTIALNRDRLYASGDTTPPAQRVYFSGEGTFTDFTYANGGGFFDVGYFWDVYAIVPIQNSILFGTRSAGWWALVGATPTGSLRQIDTYLSPGKQHEVVKSNDQVWFWNSFRGGGGQIPTLVTTNGASFDDKQYRHLRLSGPERFGCFIPLYKNVLYNASTGNAGFLLNADSWARIDYGVNISGPVTSSNTADTAIMCGDDAVGANAKFYGMRMGLDRPSFTSDADTQPGDNSTTALNAYFYTNEFYHPEARDMRVRRVIVDFTKWDTGEASNSNSFNLILRTYARYNSPSGTTDDYGTETKAWSEARSLASTTGKRDRHIFRIGDQGWSAGFQIGITAMVGVAIKRITVEYDESGDPANRRLPNPGRPT